jgi:hypothetical protein
MMNMGLNSAKNRQSKITSTRVSEPRNMRQKEIERQLRRALQFPRAWFESGLLSGEVLQMQFVPLRRDFGTRSRPIRASEHWRYGAFTYILKRAKDKAVLVNLLSVAHADPDLHLGNAMIADIKKHPLAGSLDSGCFAARSSC